MMTPETAINGDSRVFKPEEVADYYQAADEEEVARVGEKGWTLASTIQRIADARRPGPLA